jgi:uncharacterized protein YukE
MADKIRMNFPAVEDMIAALQTAYNDVYGIYERLEGFEKSIRDGALEGRAGESLAAAYERLDKVAWEFVLALDEMKKDVTKARDEMQAAMKDGSFGVGQGEGGE